jgi:DNA-binding transcriptional MerR regulator
MHGQIVMKSQTPRKSHKRKAMQIGALAKVAGMSVRAIRYYEELELLRPEGHSAGGFRLYDSSALKRLQVINFLKELGMTLTEIGKIFHAKKPSGADQETVQILKAAFKDNLRLVEEKLNALNKIGAELSRALKLLKYCERCNRKVLLDIAGCGDCVNLDPVKTLPKTLEVILR